ncbi:unnamed protein product [Linum trigynum]|uniref:B-like cyclin n=1 Tax=Linum trigynum TaxID=586398 RepID=A0AAV2DQ73_9ROSI
MEKRRSELTPETRGILVDSLVKLAEKKQLRPETLFRAVAYIDRYLSLDHRIRTTTRRRLRLLAASSMLIASKYEEVDQLNVADLVNIAGTKSRQEVLNMEMEILKKLKFEMGAPTIHTFLGELCEVVAQEEMMEMKSQLHFMASYVAELSLWDCRLGSEFSSSLVAASVMFLSRFIIKPDVHPWNDSLQRHSGYKPPQLKECVLIMHDDLNSGRKRKRDDDSDYVRTKYSTEKFKCVTAVDSPGEIPLLFFEDTAFESKKGVRRGDSAASTAPVCSKFLRSRNGTSC